MANPPVSTLIELLNEQWISTNTDGLKPIIKPITDVKVVDFYKGPIWILIHRPLPQNQESAGLGGLAKRITENVKLDIRVQGNGREDLWYSVIQEVDRILDNHILLQRDNYDILDPDGDRQDLSDKNKMLWRMLIPVKLKDLVKLR